MVAYVFGRLGKSRKSFGKASTKLRYFAGVCIATFAPEPSRCSSHLEFVSNDREQGLECSTPAQAYRAEERVYFQLHCSQG